MSYLVAYKRNKRVEETGFLALSRSVKISASYNNEFVFLYFFKSYTLIICVSHLPQYSKF